MKAEYEPFVLDDEVSKMHLGVQVDAFFWDDDRFDVDQWKLVVDPDGTRMRPADATHDVSYEKMGDDRYGYWHWSVYLFPDWSYYDAARPAAIALVRSHLGEVRYDLPRHAR